jgi:DNA-binding transcriptional ArsR family regulator
VTAYGTQAARVLDALGDPTRRRVLELLRPGPRAVGELASELPVSRPAVSQHLRVLKGAGLVTERRAGTRHLYRIDPVGLAALRTYLESFWDGALAAFADAAQGERDAADPDREEDR